MIRQQYVITCDWHRYRSITLWAQDKRDAQKQAEGQGWTFLDNGRTLCPICMMILVEPERILAEQEGKTC
jgi:hypothetical protein